MTPVLDVAEVSVAFGGLRALTRVSLAVEAGALHALVGPNGAGKTSLLNAVGGLCRVSGGEIRLNGRPIQALAPHQVAARGVARTFQFLELFRHSTVLDNLLLGRHRHMRAGLVAGALFFGRSRREQARHRRRVEEIVEFLELERYRTAMVGDLALGIQKLVAVGRALCMEPAVLLLDEPSTGMNREEKEHLARFLLRIKHELGVAMLWVEHDMELVADLADRVTVLRFGEKLAEGVPDAVLRDPAVAEAYLGRMKGTSP
jgi:branched-chain amino acid transport system ATP-binding protein